MFTVNNRILVKKGMGYTMAPYFTANRSLLKWTGFRKVEVHVCADCEGHDEMNVVMYWDTLEQFELWRASDDFKAAHKHEAQAGSDSPLLSSELIISEVVAVLK